MKITHIEPIELVIPWNERVREPMLAHMAGAERTFVHKVGRVALKGAESGSVGALDVAILGAPPAPLRHPRPQHDSDKAHRVQRDRVS